MPQPLRDLKILLKLIFLRNPPRSGFSVKVLRSCRRSQPRQRAVPRAAGSSGSEGGPTRGGRRPASAAPPDIRRAAGHGTDSFTRCSELSCEPSYCGGSFCSTGSGRADTAACRAVATVTGPDDDVVTSGARRSVADADDIHGHSPGYLPDTGGAGGEGAGSRLCLTHLMDTGRGAKPRRPGIPGPGLPRQNPPRRSPRLSSSPGPGLRRASSPRVAPGFRPRAGVAHGTSPPRPGAGNVAAGTCCCRWQ